MTANMRIIISKGERAVCGDSSKETHPVFKKGNPKIEKDYEILRKIRPTGRTGFEPNTSRLPEPLGH